MNKIQLNDKLVDIDCMHDEITTSFLENLYLAYLFAPIALFASIIFSVLVFQKISLDLIGLTITWSIASIILAIKDWSFMYWEPKNLATILYEEEQEKLMHEASENL